MFDEIVPQYAIQLMQDVFGNYVSSVLPDLPCCPILTRPIVGGAKDVRVWNGSAEGASRRDHGGTGPWSVITNVRLPRRAEGACLCTLLPACANADSSVPQAIEYVNPDQQVMFVQELSPSVLRCVKDANGNHVSDDPFCISLLALRC